MKRLGWLVAFLSLCASGTGCQDDAVSGDKRPERCSVQGETKCSTSGQLLVCDGNVFVAQSCGAGAICHAGACKAQCNANVFVPTCIQGVQRACVGGVVEERVCVEGEVCQAGACVDESALSCDATYVPRCKDDSTWSACVEGKVRESSCAENQYCFDGRCLNNVPCEEGTFSGRCATGTTMVVCRDGSERLVNCQSNQICLDGACVSDTSCNASFVDTCSADGLRIYCDGGTIRREPCPSGMACDGGMCIERVPCGEDFKDICVEGERVYCDAYGFVVTEKCPGNLKCLYGVCVSDAPCDAATYTPKCQGELFTSACVNKVEVSVECQNGQRCYGGLCQSRPSCVAGTAAICLDAHTRRDCVDGVVLDSLCDFANEVCYQGRCVNKSTVETCGAGFESYCNASEAVFCMHGLVQREVCSADQRCVDGACRKIIKPGDDCDETFVTQCLDETASAFCVGGKVQSVPCGDKVCISGACQARPCNAATFAPRCNGDFAQVVCVSGSEQVLACGTNKFCQDGLCKDSVTIGDVCNPETFVTSCHESGARLTCETKDGASTVVGTACVSPTFCLSGDCVECNSATYGKQCVDGKATTCSGGKLVQVTCGSGETCVAGECVECDVATYVSSCPNSTTQRSCVGGKIVDTTCAPGTEMCYSGKCQPRGDACDDTHPCPANYDCVKTLPSDPVGVCVFKPQCDVATFVPQCNGSSVRTCEAPGLFKDTACKTGEICSAGKCIGTECNSATYGTQCADASTPSICIDGYIVKLPACTGSTPACVDGVCRACNYATHAPTCYGDSAVYVCSPDNTMSLQYCIVGSEHCVAGKGCISLCGEGFAASCSADGRKAIVCKSGSIVEEPCDYTETCQAGACVSRIGRPCTVYTHVNVCHPTPSGPVLEFCAGSAGIQFSYCTGGGNFCGTISGIADCYQDCASMPVGSLLCRYSTYDAGIAECRAGVDYLGNGKQGFFDVNTACIGGASGASMGCHLDNVGHPVFDFVPCAMLGGGSCNTLTGGCTSLASCPAESANCTGNMANTCGIDQATGSLALTQMNCATVGATCASFVNHYGRPRAVCVGQGDFSVGGVTMSVSSLGTCSADKKTLHVMYWLSATSITARSSTCNTECVTATSGGVTYAYCK